MGKTVDMYNFGPGEPKHPNRLIAIVLLLLALVVFGNFFLNH